MLLFGQILQKNNIAYHSYANDTQIYIALLPNDYGPIDLFYQCIEHINIWERAAWWTRLKPQGAEQTSTRQRPLTMNNSNTTELDTDVDNNNYVRIAVITVIVIDIFVVVVGLPANCLAICSLYRMIRADMVVPIYIINLLIADLLQISVRVYLLTRYTQLRSEGLWIDISLSLFIFSLSASIGFMLCIALERYLVVAHPLWYRYRRNVRHATLVSVGVWVLAVIFTTVVQPLYFMPYFKQKIITTFSVLCLLPFPLLLFFFFGTKRAIAGATSVRDAEKRRIVRMLALVLGTYTVLFLPFCIVTFIMENKTNRSIGIAAFITVEMVNLSALVDPVLYILLRPDVRNTLGSLPCCQRLFTLTNCWTPRAEQETENTATVSSTVTRLDQCVRCLGDEHAQCALTGEGGCEHCVAFTEAVHRKRARNSPPSRVSTRLYLPLICRLSFMPTPYMGFSATTGQMVALFLEGFTSEGAVRFPLSASLQALSGKESTFLNTEVPES
ncbi:GPR4 protein, partial [Amia calva]|nr:GPR4 protein [Amia calva]